MIKGNSVTQVKNNNKSTACQSGDHGDTTGYKSDFNEVSNRYKSVLTQWSYLIKKLSN